MVPLPATGKTRIGKVEPSVGLSLLKTLRYAALDEPLTSLTENSLPSVVATLVFKLFVDAVSWIIL